MKKLRRLGTCDLAAANAFLMQTYWPEHNQRFTRPAAAPDDMHRRAPTARQLDQVFHLEETRTVGDDSGSSGIAIGCSRQSGHPPARSTVTVCECRDGRLAIEYRGRVMKWHEWIGVSTSASSPLPVVAVRPEPRRRRPFTCDHPWRRPEGDEGNPTVPLWRAIDR